MAYNMQTHKFLPYKCFKTYNNYFFVLSIYQDLSYSEILAGRHRAWLVKKIRFICMQSQKFKKDLIFKFKTISRTCFVCMKALTVYYIDVRYGGTYLEKMTTLERTCRFLKLEP